MRDLTEDVLHTSIGREVRHNDIFSYLTLAPPYLLAPARGELEA